MKAAVPEVTLLRHEHGWVIQCPMGSGRGLSIDLFPAIGALPDIPTRGPDKGGVVVATLARYYSAVLVIAFTREDARKWRAELREQLRTEYPEGNGERRALEARLSRWVLGPDAGASSTYLARRLSDQLTVRLATQAGAYISHAERAAPRDDDDFRRCVALLEAVPEFRPILETTMAGDAEWAPWIDGWDERAARLGPAPE